MKLTETLILVENLFVSSIIILFLLLLVLYVSRSLTNKLVK